MPADTGAPDVVASSIGDLVGNTPLLRLSFPELPRSVRVLAKLEGANPLASVKDRPALYMLRDAEARGVLDPNGGTVVEYSSGNMGIALAGLCASMGHRYILVMPDNATEERRKIVAAFGAEIILTPHEEGLTGTIARAEEVQRSIPGAWLVNQAYNQVNSTAHYETTGREIWDACAGEVDVLVSAVGTGGTLTGSARFLKERRDVYVVAVEPDRSPVLSGGSHTPHGIPGIGPGFVAEVTDLACINEVITVSDEDAGRSTRQLARSAGVFAGVSSGAAVHAAKVMAQRPEWIAGTVVVVLPDTGERYLSLWDTLGAREGER